MIDTAQRPIPKTTDQPTEISSSLASFYKSRIALKLVLATLVFSLFVSLTSTLFQLYADYKRELKVLNRQLDSVKEMNLAILAESLWLHNEENLYTQLLSISSLPEIGFTEVLTTSGDSVIAMGIQQHHDFLSRNFPLWRLDSIHPQDSKQVGSLIIVAPLNPIRERVLSSLPVSLATNFGKVILVSIFFFIMFHTLVTRRLRLLAEAISRSDIVLPASDKNLKLRRDGLADEMDQVANAVIDLKSRLGMSYRELKKAHDDLQRKIIEQTRTEESLRASEERLKRVISAAPVMLFVADASGRIQMLEGLSARSLSFKVNNPIGSPVLDVFHDSDRFQSLLKRALAGEKFTSELVINNTSFEVRFSPIISQQGLPSGFIAVALDITNRITYEQKLIEAKQGAEMASKAKSQFIANVSHEIRTPLGAIIGFTELLEKYAQLNETSSGYLSTIRRNAQLLLNLVNDLLDLSKIESGQLVIDKEPCELRDLIADVVETLTPLARKKSLEVRVTVEGKVPETIVTDKVRFRQILSNVLGNAIKFTDKGTIEVLVRMAQSDEPGQSKLIIDVTDSGIGISLEERERIFRPFGQTDASVARRFGGSGLGLSLSRRLANSLGGDVLLKDSSPGHGSTFTISINPGNIAHMPFIESLVISRQGRSETPIVEDLVLKGRRLLIVEDSEDNQILFKNYLMTAGAEVDIAEGGNAGIHKALNGTYDAVLMDIQMPDIDGYQVTSILRAKGYQVPIIALTAHAMKGDLEKCLAAGCNHYLSKPVSRQNLVAQIVKFCRFHDKLQALAIARQERRAQEQGAKTMNTSHSPSNNTPEAAAAANKPALSGPSELHNKPEAENNEWPEDRYAQLRSLYHDDPRMVQIIEDFKKRLPKRIWALRQSLIDHDLTKTSSLAHQLKGALGGYGFTDLCKHITEFENHLKQEPDHATLLSLIEQLDQLAAKPAPASSLSRS